MAFTEAKGKAHKTTETTKKTKNLVTIIKDTEDYCIFEIDYPEVFLANAIRRSIESDVQTYSPDVSTFVINNNVTKFHNERISDRISQIPINNNDNIPDGLTFKLSLKNTDQSQISTIQSQTTQPTQPTHIYSVIHSIPVMSDGIISSDGKKYFPDGIPIVNLRSGESLDIAEFKLKKGTCSDSAIHKSTCCVGYKVIEQNELKKVRITVEPRLLQNGVAYPMSAKKAIHLAFGSLIDRLSGMNKKIRDNSVQVDFVKELAIMKIDGEGHTTGNLIQGQIVLDSSINTQTVFCGYSVEHPLSQNLIFKLTSEQPKDVISDAITKLVNLLEKAKKQFE